MILTKEQINRYMRHIIMPEISGPGQKKLLGSTAFIYGETVKDVSPLIYYLAASGIGYIFCCFEDDSDYETLFCNIQDLNRDTSIKLIYAQSLDERKDLIYHDNQGAAFRVFLGSSSFVNSTVNNFINHENENIFIPTIIAIKNQCKGILQTFKNFHELKTFIGKLSDKLLNKKPGPNEIFSENFYGNIFAASILGTLCSIEFIKLCLNLGEINKELLYIDIFSMEFSKIEKNKTDYYMGKLLNNESAKNSYDGIEGKLSKCSVLIVGTGGLGSPAAFALSIAGVGTIGLIDYDTVEISNLNRQILHSTSRIGMPKVESAKEFLKSINPDINIITYNIGLTKDNAMGIIKDYDIIIDGVDNLPTRYLLNDACYFMKKPMIEAGVLRFSGLNTTIIPDNGHCYRCAFPDMPNAGSVPSCKESGILGPIPGVMGFIQAAEAIKLAAGEGCTLKNKLLYFEALDLEFTIIEMNKNPFCPLCGEHAVISSLQEYEFTCEIKQS